MSKIKYSSQWEIEKIESEYVKDMQEDYQQQLAFSQENQFNDYQYDYSAEHEMKTTDENYYNQLKKSKQKLLKLSMIIIKNLIIFLKTKIYLWDIMKILKIIIELFMN